ncbi:MAG: DUF3365 domain-containing protein [Leptolyngbyaceae cyanobacterium MO_188.B28]|nr:DUF3365 domain-containing protein [Leptolyngbyaceae cyanobacterium MO_188.B28]
MVKSDFKKTISLERRIAYRLITTFLAVLLLSGTTLFIVLYQSSLNELVTKGLILIETMNSVGQYTSQEVSPELISRLDEEFLPETVSAYSIREVFENFQEGYNVRDFSAFSYKVAVLNPTNLADKADSFETAIIDSFRKTDDNNPSRLTKEATGFRVIDENRFFYVARPIKVTSISCLRCHSSPEVAPQSMVQKYGAKNGFGWELNEVVGAQMIHIPIKKTFQETFNHFSIIISVFTVSLFAFVSLVYLWIRGNVVKPINYMATVAERSISSGDPPEFGNFPIRDEIWKLANAFNRVSQSLRQKAKSLERQRLRRRGDLGSAKQNGFPQPNRDFNHHQGFN